MDFQTVVAKGLKHHLKCFVCENYLSYFPISICSNGQHICGRCTTPDGLTSFKDTAYETLAQFLEFPCRYSSEGCFEELLPQKVEEHEENCPFRVVECIVEKPNKCEWKGSLATLFQHCRNEHSQIILEDGEFEVSVGSTQEYDDLVEIEGRFFVFRRKFDPENRVLEFAMFSNKYDSNTCVHGFKLKARSGRKSVSLDFQSSTYKEHVFDYFELKCVTTESHGEIKIKLSRKHSSESRGSIQKNNSELLENLKCSKCSKFLIPPIYQRRKNSNNYFCLDCKNECDESSSSDDESEPFRQCVLLEKFASFLTYPCENYQNGCLFNAVYPEIKTHQTHCKYRKRECPFKFFSDDVCTWTGLDQDTYKHVLQESKKHYVRKITSNFEWCFKRDTFQYGLIIHFCDRLFFLAHGMENSNYFWSLGKISECNDRFRYEITIVDETNEGRRLSVGKPCCNNFEEFVSNYNKDVTNEDYQCTVNRDQFSSVFKEKQESKSFKYRLRMFKC